MEYLGLIGDVGFPIASALAGGFFVFLTLKFILAGVLDDIKTQRMFVKSLQNRIGTMNNELLKIDIMISHAFSIRPDMNRVARSKGQEDHRKD
jgi:hypothetical protein|tara:strand:- start:877 stop:1155 length:279 start_codon:yes stop_codon:yes gene_type:complete